jgi:hypothetical protein
MPFPPQSSWFDYLNNIWWGVGSWRSSLSSLIHSRYLVPLRPKRLAQYPIHVPPSVCETKLHTHIKQQAKSQFHIFLSLYFWTANWNTKDSGLNGSRHPPSSISSQFLHKCNFYLLVLFTNTLLCHCLKRFSTYL